MTLNRKNKYLLGGIAIFMIVAWQATIKNTVAYRSEYKLLQPEKLIQKQNQLTELISRNNYLEKALHKRNINNTSVRNTALQIIAHETYQLRLLDYNDEHRLLNDDVQITYHKFKIEGSYMDIVTATDSLLRKVNTTSLKNIHLETQTDFQTRKTALVATVILEEKQAL